MAVFFNLDAEAVASTIGKYGEIYKNLVSIKPIEEGSENSNYFVSFNKGGELNKCVLTIFGPRTNPYNVQFYVDLQNALHKNHLPSPFIYKTDKGLDFGYINDKPFLIASFLQGASKKNNNLSPKNCFDFGALLASFHLTASAGVKDVIENSFWIFKFKEIFKQCTELGLDGWELNYFQNELNKINFTNSPFSGLASGLPFGIIHADPFPDNAFFNEDDDISGFFDFYFASSGYFAYDLAIAVLSWCFDESNNLVHQRLKSMLQGYQSKRVLTPEEQKFMPYFIDIAALRFYSTRMLDRLTSRIDVSKKAKDPNDFRIRKMILQDNIRFLTSLNPI